MRLLTNDDGTTPLSSVIRLKSMTESKKNTKNQELLSPLRLKKRLTMGDPDFMRKISIPEKINISLKDEELKRGVKRIIEVTGNT